MASTPFITVRFFRWQGRKAQWWAFGSQGFALRQPWSADGLRFAKQLGSGAGSGFSIWPDFSTYAWFGVWDTEAQASAFFEGDARWAEWRASAQEEWGWNAQPVRGHGSWGGVHLLEGATLATLNPTDEVAVLTRARIKWSQAIRFWWNVPGASRHLDQLPDLMYRKGVGELPLVEQATLSVWRNAEALDAFAYRSREHAPMVRKTREYGWYSEEMFLRMKVLDRWEPRPILDA